MLRPAGEDDRLSVYFNSERHRKKPLVIDLLGWLGCTAKLHGTISPPLPLFPPPLKSGNIAREPGTRRTLKLANEKENREKCKVVRLRILSSD